MILSDITIKLRMPREERKRKAPERFNHGEEHVTDAERKRRVARRRIRGIRGK